MYGLVWREFEKGNRGRIITKVKRFKTEAALVKFVDKVRNKVDFFEIASYINPC